MFDYVEWDFVEDDWVIFKLCDVEILCIVFDVYYFEWVLLLCIYFDIYVED